MSKAKDDFIARTVKVWNPGKTLQWQRDGVDLVIDRREGYFLHDMDGRRLIDLHLNGGIYSLGHRNPEVIAALKEGLDTSTSATTIFPSIARTMLAEMLAEAHARGTAVFDVRLGRRRGDRHRAEERAPCDQAATAHLPAALLSRPYRPGGEGRRRPLLEALPLGGRRGRGDEGALQRSRRDGARDHEGRRRLRDHRDDPGDLRLSDAEGRAI